MNSFKPGQRVRVSDAKGADLGHATFVGYVASYIIRNADGSFTTLTNPEERPLPEQVCALGAVLWQIPKDAKVRLHHPDRDVYGHQVLIRKV